MITRHFQIIIIFPIERHKRIRNRSDAALFFLVFLTNDHEHNYSGQVDEGEAEQLARAAAISVSVEPIT